MVTLYKKDSKGKIRQIKLSIAGNILVQESGILDGKMVKNERVCSGKNEGKRNATTAGEQAIFELKSKVSEKLKEAYFETIEEAESIPVTMPMLAKTLDLDKVVYPVMVQPKLDGMRMIATSTSKLSRKNTPIETLPHIDASWLGKNILDGEVYAHGKTFQENMKLIKKYRAGETEEVAYHVYDLPSCNAPFEKRHEVLRDIIVDRSDIILVEAYQVNSRKELLKYHSLFVSQGYEGTMVRLLVDTTYEFNKRSKTLLKFKDFIDEVYQIIDIVPSEKRPNEGVVLCEMLDGKTFKCGMKLSRKDREIILLEKEAHIGKMGEVRFFEFSDTGVPRFPVFHGIRLDK